MSKHGVYAEIEVIDNKPTVWVWSAPVGERGPGTCVCILTCDGISLTDEVVAQFYARPKMVEALKAGKAIREENN